MFTINGEVYSKDVKNFYGDAVPHVANSDGEMCVRIKMDEPCPTGDVTSHTAANAFNKVLEYVGASLYRDNVDARYVEEAKTGTCVYTGSITKSPGLIDLVSDVNGYTEANFETGTRPTGFDTDNDGIPDEWETANGLNPNNASDAVLYTLDTEKRWYTNIEVYANSLVEHIVKAQNADAITAVDEYYPKYNTTGISVPTVSSEVSKIEYYTLDGRKIAEPTNGINIRKITLSNGRVIADKVLK